MANILHVEDDPSIRMLFGLQFGRDHNITAVASMAEAMKKLASMKFDLVIADYKLGITEPTGADLADDMKRKLDATPMILLTGDSSQMKQEFRAKHSAIKEIVDKPPSVAGLKVVINRVIAESMALETAHDDREGR